MDDSEDDLRMVKEATVGSQRVLSVYIGCQDVYIAIRLGLKKKNKTPRLLPFRFPNFGWHDLLRFVCCCRFQRSEFNGEKHVFCCCCCCFLSVFQMFSGLAFGPPAPSLLDDPELSKLTPGLMK